MSYDIQYVKGEKGEGETERGETYGVLSLSLSITDMDDKAHTERRKETSKNERMIVYLFPSKAKVLPEDFEEEA
jgi:hypothetical protein